MTRLLLIRHAHVDSGSRLCGWLDVPLSRAGRARLQALVRRGTSREAPAALYTSPLARAREVADALAERWQLEPFPADAAREIHCGVLEGRRFEEIEREYPELWARNNAQAEDTFAWPEGESYADFRARVLAACGEIAARHPGQRVALVTHSGVIAQVLGTIRGRTAAAWEQDRPDPLTATEVTWTNGLPVAVLTYNDGDWY